MVGDSRSGSGCDEGTQENKGPFSNVHNEVDNAIAMVLDEGPFLPNPVFLCG